MQEQKVGEGEGGGMSRIWKDMGQAWGSLKLVHDPEKEKEWQRGGNTQWSVLLAAEIPTAMNAISVSNA